MARTQRRHLVIGGGPAGLTAGYYLAKRGEPVLVVEAEDQLGGIAKTKEHDGYRFDLGGHRFFTKAKEVDDMWHEVLDEEFLLRPRMSRIYWNKKFLMYPLEGMDVIKQLGPIELMRCGLSYLWAAVKPKGREDDLETWVSNRFGKRLYSPLLQDLHREGLGRAVHRAARRVGRAAHQGPVVLQRRQGRLLRQQGQQDQVADRPVPLPALRPRPAVGGDGARDREARRRGAPERAAPSRSC